jgi:hypothetical protein
MTNYKLAYIEHISQLLNYKVKKLHVLTGNTLLELESIQSYLKELSRVYAEYQAEEGLAFDE